MATRIIVVVEDGIAHTVLTDCPRARVEVEIIDLDTQDEGREQSARVRLAEVRADKSLREVY